MAETLGATLVLQALALAVLHRDPPANLLFHSDRGVPYAAGIFGPLWPKPTWFPP